MYSRSRSILFTSIPCPCVCCTLVPVFHGAKIPASRGLPHLEHGARPHKEQLCRGKRSPSQLAARALNTSDIPGGYFEILKVPQKRLHVQATCSVRNVLASRNEGLDTSCIETSGEFSPTAAPPVTARCLRGKSSEKRSANHHTSIEWR
jgi:hypothetical protein